MSDTLPPGVQAQPINRITWLQRDLIDANDYNPNHVAPPEMRLLRRSILADGWLFPILVCPPAPTDVTDKSHVIVDGYHRWKVSGDKDVYALTGGYVPCIVLPIAMDRAHRMAMTVRMNRAKGTHHVRGMAHIVGEMAVALGVTPEEVIANLGMDGEEFQRLLDKGKMTARHGRDDFQKGWVPG